MRALRQSARRARRRIAGLPDELTQRGDYLSREEALHRLGIKPQTLYSYVSRGRIHSIRSGRRSLYSREDVERAQSRTAARSGAGPAAAGAIRWGEPVITTFITEISAEGPRYRGIPAADLVRARTRFENVAEYLWTGQLPEEPVIWACQPVPRGFDAFVATAVRLHENSHPLQIMGLVVSALGIGEGTRRERIRRGRTPVEAARATIFAMIGTMGLLGPRRAFTPPVEGVPVAAQVLHAVAPRAAADAVRAVDAALVLAADHELNPATFAARVAASGSGDMHSCIGAALHTHYGTLVGRACDRLEEMFPADATPAAIVERAREMMRTARLLPGFNHLLYPRGDPRARKLLEIALLLGGARPAVRNLMVALRRLEDEFALRPSIECGLVALCRAVGLPRRSAASLYALGRTAGWVAHVLEQRLAGFVIRPRARFAGGGTPP